MQPIIEQEKILEILQSAPCSLAGQFINGSNYTFFITLKTQDGDVQAVYKPVRGETPLWDFPTGSLARREVAAYHLSEVLGWHIVPPTVYRKKKLPFGAGSVQQFIDSDPQKHYFNLSLEEKERLRPVALFDCLINNADRKGSHILLTTEGRIYCIDHGICFHVENKLRTVIWDFAGQPIPSELLNDLDRLVSGVLSDQQVYPELSIYLRKGEIKAMAARAKQLLKSGKFPESDNTLRQFPWPPV
jgi:uncharacterized repeat protein (TIGR03843 family)